jgi:NNP family nitrate/nitrite transporter-like MFS transporter
MPVTLRLSLLYAVAFGGFVAFSVYLPAYLTTAYHLDRADAALRTAGFVVLAVAMRPVGGALSDRLHWPSSGWPRRWAPQPELCSPCSPSS